MPTYEYQCKECSSYLERVLPLSEYRSKQFCSKCGGELTRLLSRPIIRGDIEPYRCPVTGKPITSRAAHEENLKRTGCRVLEKGEKEEAERFRAKADSDMLRGIEDTAAKFVASLPQEKKERLAGELGPTTYVRG